MAEYNIYISDKNKRQVFKMPIVPTEFPVLNKVIENEEFKTYSNGTYNNIKAAGLDNFTLESWLPTKKYSFAKSDVLANEFIDFINYVINNKQYVYVAIIANGKSYINDKFSIENWNYGVKRNGDYSYSLGFKQYREYSNNNYKLGWNKDATGWWYCTSVEEYTWYSNGWQNIDNVWYYFNANGYALYSQWLLWQNKWYYLDENCKMVAGKWLKISGKWYYFYANGIMASNTTIDGYVIGTDGSWRE